MIDLQNAPPGYTSTVHQGPLTPVLIFHAPHTPVMFNLLLGMLACLWLSWRWVLVTLVIHGLMAALTRYDPHLLGIVTKHLRYKPFYGTW